MDFGKQLSRVFYAVQFKCLTGGEPWLLLKIEKPTVTTVNK